MSERFQRSRRTAWSVPVVLVATLYATDALGHKLNVFANVEGRTIHGEVYFRGGIPAQDAKLEVFDSTGGKLEELTTDKQGKFSFQARLRCDHHLVANAGEGHGAEYTVEAGDLPDDLPSPGGERTAGTETPALATSPISVAQPATLPPDARLKMMIEAVVSKQIGSLRRQLDDYEQRIRIRDILGGIGYIFGLTGLLFFFLGIRKKPGNR